MKDSYRDISERIKKNCGFAEVVRERKITPDLQSNYYCYFDSDDERVVIKVSDKKLEDVNDATKEKWIEEIIPLRVKRGEKSISIT